MPAALASVWKSSTAPLVPVVTMHQETAARFPLVGVSLLAALLLCALPSSAQHEEHQHGNAKAEKPVVFLDKAPRIVAYQLSRLSNAQLLLVDREATDPKFIPVYQAILDRPGMDSKQRAEALKALAVLNKSDETAEILAALQRIGREKGAPVVHELSRLLAAQKPDDLKKHKAALEKIAGEGTETTQREAAFAALAASQPADAVWSLAQGANATAQLLASLPLVSDASARGAFFAKVQPLLQTDTDPATLRGAAAAAAAMPGHEADVFSALANLFTAGKERPAIARALSRIPKDKWPANQLQPLGDAVLSHAKSVPPAGRTENDYLDIDQLGKDIAARLPKNDGARLRKALAGLGVNVLRLRTLHEQMFYDKTLLVVEAGKPVLLIFENTDTMQHNWVLVAPGALEEIGMAGERMTPTPDKQGRLYVPDSPKVLQATRTLNPGETARLNFTAPGQPGKYPYVCTYPGHWQRMRGELLVVEDLEAYFTRAPAEPAEPTITEWKLADLAGDLPKLASGRNYAKGKELFTHVGCVACHRLGEEGVPYGPDLTGVFAKYHGDRQRVLGEILEPSRHLEPRYQPISFTPANGEPFTGFLVEEKGDMLLIQIGPGESLIQKFAKKDIARREPQTQSLMPAGLLNLLSREQILDLLAYLEAGGNPQHAAFKP